MSKQHANCSPYDFNGGACAAMAGSDYRVIAADTRMSTGYNILTRVYSKIAKLADKAFLASSGFQADVRALQKHLSMRHLIYQHQHHKQMSCPAMAQLLSNTLFYKRFFPYYAFNVLGGLDNEGKGCVFTYDAVGSYEKVGYSSQGSGSKLIMPFLDNNQLIMLLARITMSKQHTNRSFYDFNGGFCKTLEILAVRCCVPEAANQTTILSMDMYHEILKRLPVQSLCRCRCVCKTWNSHIRSQQFIAAHHAAARGSQILCATTAAGFLFTYALERARLDRFLTQPHMIEGKIKQKYVLLESETYRSIMDFQFPFEFPNYKPVEILACVNGVLVLTVVTPYEGRLFHIILWNPMVHKWIFLPQPQIRPKRHLHLSGIDSLGFGYDPSSGDLRVVRLLYIRPPADDFAKGTDFFTYDADADMDECEWNERRLDCPPGFWPYMEGWPFFPGNAYCYPPKVEVCHVKERVWRRVNTCADNDKVLNTTFVGMCAQQQCYLNASVHWVARAYNNKSDHESFSTLLLAFNFESERFRSIKLPDQLAQLNPSQSHIASVSAFRGSALLISQYTIEAWEFGCCSLWLMTDYSDPASWAKLVSVQLSTDIDWVVWLNSAEDEEVLVSRKMCQLTMYDSVCQANRGIGSNKADRCLDRTVLPYAWAFKESLYLLDENLP